LINQKDIQSVLRYAAFDRPTLGSRCQQLSSDALELQFRKKKLNDEVATQRSSISKLEKSLNWYKVEIKQKKEIISNLDQQLNHKSDALKEKLIIEDPNRDANVQVIVSKSLTLSMRKPSNHLKSSEINNVI
jgi:chromosome segregation ATPase